MILAFVAAGIGNLIRTKLIKHHFTLFLNIAVSISASCFIYAAFLKIAEMVFNVPSIHEAGYICSMLFIIPGFPFITSGIDLAKLDLRSGLERLAYAIIIVMVATMFAWIMALLLRLQPMDFEDLNLTPVLHLILRLIMSFFGVFGFSIMFNSPAPMAATAALIGAIANSLRLELVDLTGMPAPAAAFAGALTAADSLLQKSDAGDIGQHPLFIRLKAELDKAEGITAEEKEYLLALLKNPCESGVDLKKDLFFFMSMDGAMQSPNVRGGMLLPVGDKAKLDALLARIGEKSGIAPRHEGGISVIALGEDSSVSGLCAYNDVAVMLH